MKKEVSCLPFYSCVCIVSQESIVGQFIYTYTEAYLGVFRRIYDGALFTGIVNS